ncbi:asparaginase [Citricoccus sp. K5]|uniref:asparaginase n=1 Tax=Citricoccus sp. K5 TaxID=2653135 RepID=UPI0012F27A8C|nr:asparaginase [Citricoccus sp. K5]VXB78366.1 Asparaginase [Citricoccus sp. K5]
MLIEHDERMAFTNSMTTVPGASGTTPGIFAQQDAAELVYLTRNGQVESRHSGAAVVTGPDGGVLATVGPADAVVFGRSALKPLQAIASLRLGAPLESRHIAIASGSHRGSSRHRALVREILAAAGLDKTALQCPRAWPKDRRELLKMAARTRRPDGPRPNRLAFNCSGKHAAWLSACVAAGLETESYLEPDHPLQQEVLRVIEDYCGTEPVEVGVDGCGGPAPRLALAGLARGFGRVASAPERAAQGLPIDDHAVQVAVSMLRHPWAVQGRNSSNTRIMRELGVLAKSGADGILVVAAPDGTAVAVKTLDGASRANNLVALNLLARFAPDQVELPALRIVLDAVTPTVLGRGQPVGRAELADPVLEVLTA